MTILKLLKLILEIIRIIVGRRDAPPKPGPMTVHAISEENGMLRYEANFPTLPTGTDIVSQKFTASQNGSDDVQTLGVDDTSAQFLVPDAAEVTLTLVYIDDAGNESAPRTQAFTASDTIPPSAPGEFGEIELLGEE